MANDNTWDIHHTNAKNIIIIIKIVDFTVIERKKTAPV